MFVSVFKVMTILSSTVMKIWVDYIDLTGFLIPCDWMNFCLFVKLNVLATTEVRSYFFSPLD